MDNIEIYKLGGVLDASTSRKEQEGILAILNNDKNIALDLSGCSYVSSAGLRVMLYSYKVAASKGLKLYLISVSKDVKEVMAITGFERFFTFFGSIDDCLKA